MPDRPLQSINPSRISLARRRRGYTKSELAQKLGVTIQTVMAYERAAFPPAPDTLVGLQRALGFPSEFFFGPDLEEPQEDAASFRALRSMTSRLRSMARGQGTLAIQFACWLEKKFDLPRPNLPDLGRESETPGTAAEVLRREWGLGQLSIRNMVHLLEANGVRVFSISIEARQVDAFSLWNGTTPFVFLNGFKSAEHSRFDAAHELGHLVLHRRSVPNGIKAEEQANRFASSFLMPEDTVLANTPRFPTVDTLVKLKSIWGVSVASLVYRMHEVGAVSDWQYRKLFVELTRRGYRTQEPEECARESSIVLPKLLAYLYKEEGMTRGAIAKELCLPPSEIESLLFGLTMAAVSGSTDGKSSPENSFRSDLFRVK